jgi:hypothetical protein
MTTIVNASLKRLTLKGLVFTASLGLLFIHLPAMASGSIGVGSGGIGTKAAYRQGKKLFYSKIVCSECPIQRDDMTRERAVSLAQSLETRNEEKSPEDMTEDDGIIKLLCRHPVEQSAEEAGDCADKPDEQEMVHYFLNRRYKLKRK